MLRKLSLLAVLAGTLLAGGCRACSSCHDYDPPVLDCQCGRCGCQRAGSAGAGYATDGSGYATSPTPAQGQYVEEPQQ